MLRRQYLAQAEEESKMINDELTEKRLMQIQEGKIDMNKKEKELFEKFVKR